MAKCNYKLSIKLKSTLATDATITEMKLYVSSMVGAKNYTCEVLNDNGKKVKIIFTIKKTIAKNVIKVIHAWLKAHRHSDGGDVTPTDISDNFESYTVGDTLNDIAPATIDTAMFTNALYTFMASSDPVASGISSDQKILGINSFLAGRGEHGLSLDFDEVPFSIIEGQISIYCETPTAATIDAYCVYDIGNILSVWIEGSTTRSPIINFGGSCSIIGTVPYSATFDTWYTLKYNLNCISGLISIWINGTEILNSPFAHSQLPGSVSRLSMCNGSIDNGPMGSEAAAQKCYFDDWSFDVLS